MNKVFTIKDRAGGKVIIGDSEKFESIKDTTLLENGSYSYVYHNVLIQSYKENDDETITVVLCPDYQTASIDK